MNWVSIHNHTDGSVLDGACSIDKLIDRALELNMPALGITDHGNMTKAYEFYTKCVDKGIKPIIGCEFYVGEPDTGNTYHIICVAKNNDGLTNLYKLNAYSYKHNFYRKPRITFDKLIEYSSGLIVTTACLGSVWGEEVSHNIESSATLLNRLHDIFGDDLYFEVQANNIRAQRVYNEWLVQKAAELNVQLMASCDVHYVKKENFKAHDVMLAMQTKKKVSDPNRFKFSCNDFYVKNGEQIVRELVQIGLSMDNARKAIYNTLGIANKCNVSIDKKEDMLPIFNNLSKSGASKLLREHLTTRYWDRYSEPRQDVIDRVFYELSVIENKGYSGYFLIVEDAINYAKANGIYVGPGRGSAAGCMVSYILGITEVDPIEHGLLFERFLNPDRNTSPDIDVDIDYELRHVLIDYIKNKYGEDNVAQIMAEGTLAPMAVLRRVLGVFDHPQRVITQVSKTLRGTGVKSLKEAYNNNSEFKAHMDNMQEEFSAMLTLEGLMSHESTHAAGLVITPQPVYTLLPCSYDRELGLYKTQWHKDHVEDIGLYKFDFLGLKTLSVMRKTHENILKNSASGDTCELPKISDVIYNDGVYSLLNSGKLDGIFQFDQQSGRQALERIQPKSFGDVVAATALCRPGVVEAELYYSNKEIWGITNNQIVPEYWELVKDILEPTYGAIVYQEQTMLLMNKLTGGRWSLGKADSMRKVKDLEEYREDFVRCASENGVHKAFANEIFNRFDLGYSFNKSHAVAYSYISCYCAFLKHYYPKEFYAALMTIEALNTDNDLVAQIREVRASGISILPPDIRVSRSSFVPTEEGIRYPLTAIKNVGNRVVEWMEDGNNADVFNSASFSTLISQIPKRVFNKRAMVNLIKAGAFDSFNKNRSLLLKTFYDSRKDNTQVYTWGREVCMHYEMESLGINLTYHPLDGIAVPDWDRFQEGSKATTLGIICEVKVIQDRNGNTMAFATLMNKTNTIELVVFSRFYKKYENILREGVIIQCEGKKEADKLIVDRMEVA